MSMRPPTTVDMPKILFICWVEEVKYDAQFMISNKTYPAVHETPYFFVV